MGTGRQEVQGYIIQSDDLSGSEPWTRVLSDEEVLGLQGAILRGLLQAVLESQMEIAPTVVASDRVLLEAAEADGVPATRVPRGGVPSGVAKRLVHQVGGGDPVLLLAAELPLLWAGDLAFFLGRLRQGASLVLAHGPPYPAATLVESASARDLSGYPLGAECGPVAEAVQDVGGSVEVYASEAALSLQEVADLLRVVDSPRATPAKGLLGTWGMRQRIQEWRETG